MKILITGGEGFTGCAMIPYLREYGFDVYATSRQLGNGLLYCDILDVNTVENIIYNIKPDYILHFAGIALPNFPDIHQMYNINIFGAKNILDAVLKSNHAVQKIIIASSAHVYGDAISNVPLKEDVCVKPNSHYSNSKYAMEVLVRLYFDKLPIIITRPFNYTGFGQSTDYIIPKLIENYQQKKPQVVLGDINVIRDFSDLQDVLFFYYKLLTSTLSGEVINLCSGHGISISEIIDILDKLCGYKIKVVSDTTLVRKGDKPIFIGDNTKLDQIMGKYSRVTITQTLKNMVSAKNY